MLKRAFDILSSLLLIIVTSPLMILAWLLVWQGMGLPILFRQIRPGRGGQPFTLYKFRTMADIRDTLGNLKSDELRLTHTGKWLRQTSIDELPQLFNVLKGDMSLVGPRPLLMEYLPLYTSEQARRHDVKPGITGWAQVHGRNAISWEEKFTLDIWYVDHQSFWLDLIIIAKTAVRTLSRDGINQQGSATAEPFKGSATHQD